MISLWIKAGIPLVAAPVAFFDDQFFARTAHHLLAKQWLGPYDKMTLSKGMFYPLFIAASSFLAVPLKIAEQLAYLFASGITAVAVYRAAGRRWVALAAFAGLAFNPVMWNHWMARVSRETLYSSLSLLLFALILFVSFPELRRSQKQVQLGLATGAVWAANWLTREESIWLLPTCLVALGLGGLSTWVRTRSPNNSWSANVGLRNGFRAIAVPLLLSFVVFQVGVGIVAALNWHYYGVFRTNEFRSGGFVRAYGALARIKGSHFQRFVPIPLDARQKAYEVSAAARELSNSLDGNQGHGWARLGCSLHPIPAPCDLQGGWFTWALRDATEGAGHYKSATDAEAFYTALADQIDSACKAGKIECTARRDSLAPPFRWQYVGETLPSAKGLAKIVLDLGHGEVGAVPSVGSAQGLETFADLTDENISPPAEGIVRDFPLGMVDGWVAVRSETPTLQVIPYTRREVKSSIVTTDAPDVLAAHPDLKSVRFTLQSDCPVLECDLAIQSGAEQVRIPFRDLKHGAPIDTPNRILFIDRTTVDEMPSHIAEHRRGIQQKVGHQIGTLYAKLSRVLALLAGAGLLIAIIRFRLNSGNLPLIALALGSLTAVVCRILLLAYIDATTFSTYYLHYCSPATPFLIAFVVSGLYLGWATLTRNLASKEPTS